MHKGPDRATIVIQDNVQNGDNGRDSYHYEVVDKIKQYLDCRYVSPVDAIWKIFEFDTTYRYPSVELLQYHFPGQQYVVFNDRNELHQVVNAARERSLC